MTKNTKQLHQFNTQLCRDILKSTTYSTKNSLSKDSGLSVATCFNILTELLASNEVLELSLDASSGGRPARRFCYNKDYASALSLYIRKEGTDISVFTLITNSIGEEAIQHVYSEPSLNIESFDKILCSVINDNPSLMSIAISIPGIIKNNIIIDCDIPSLNGYPIKSFFEEKYNIKTVIDNDVNIVITGYYRHLIDKNPESLCFLYFPKNGLPGMGIIVNGKIIKGFTNSSGEIKHTVTNSDSTDLLTIQAKPNLFATYIVELIQSISSIINPEYMIFSGLSFTDSIIYAINQKITKHTLNQYFPKLIFEDDIHDSLIIGLKYLNQINIKSIHGGQHL